MRFKSGTIGHMDLTRQRSYGYDQRIEFFGSKGMIQVNNPPNTSTVYSTGNGQLHDLVQPTFLERFSEAYYNELVHFVDCLFNGAAPKTTHESVRNTYILAEACLKSSKTNQVVKVDYTITEG